MSAPEERPDERPDERLERKPPGRRKVLQWLGRGFLSLWGLGFLAVIAGFLKPPRTRRDLVETVLRVGSLDSIPVGRGQLVQHGREPIWVLRTAEQTLVGLSAVCTHLHCVLKWDEAQGELACPCHEGAFDVNGNVLGGPAPRALKRYRVDVRLGNVYVHL